MTQYKTAFKRHVKQLGSFAKAHKFMKEFYKRDEVNKWTVKEGEQKTKSGFKTRIDIIEEFEDFALDDATEEIFEEVPLES